jgi:hypothetical protein
MISHSDKDFADGSKLMVWRWKDYLGLSDVCNVIPGSFLNKRKASQRQMGVHEMIVAEDSDEC